MMESEVQEDDHRLSINVGGKTFVTFRSTLRRLPETKLGRLSPDDPSYDLEKKCYFFDRNPKLFGHILDLYRIGQLHFPHCICGPFIKQELEYWGLEEAFISDCCWRAYSSYEQEREKMKTVEKALYRHSLHLKAEHARKEAEERGEGLPRGGGWSGIKQATWFFLEDPTSSVAARVWALIFLLVIIMSVAIQCMITHPLFRFKLDEPKRNISKEDNPKIILFVTTELLPVIWYLDFSCFVILALEIFARIVVCPHKLEFLKSVYNVVDLLCVIPMTMLIVVEYIYPDFWTYSGVFNLVFFLTFLGFFRILRLIKFARHYQAMSILLLSLRASLKELFLLIMLIGIGMLIFSYLIYFAEFGNSTDFDNIPVGFWWAIVTMTTVGYGDKKPITEWGYVVGAMCALTGMLSTGLPIPIIASNFNMYYTYAKRSILQKGRPRKKPPFVNDDARKPKVINRSTQNSEICSEVNEISATVTQTFVEEIRIESNDHICNGRPKGAWVENIGDVNDVTEGKQNDWLETAAHLQGIKRRMSLPSHAKKAVFKGKNKSKIDVRVWSANGGFEPEVD